MKLFPSKRRSVVLALLLVLALFLLRPGASRLKSRIITSISAAVGRPVDIGAVHIQVLPRPGFDIDNLVVYDDPEFGAEPILRANEVTAILRLTSLLRGRLEISRLDLTEPSLNLVHSASGRWNLEALLEHTSQIPLAPTSKPKTESRSGFPYIEVSSGRINFKSGAEKRPYALTNADFSLWQESENAWGIRLKAQPARTDLNLTDMGLLRINGTWQRAQTFRDTPLQFNLEWNRAQLGQFTKLFTGNDKGWRGTILVDVDLSGTPGNLKISSTASLDDFRRYDITSGKALRLGAHCDGKYSNVTHDFHEVLCSAPVGNGLLTLTGDVGLPGSHQFAVMLRALNVPASAALVLAERSRKNLPDDLEADGTLRADISMQENAAAGALLQLKGGGQFTEFRLTSAANRADLILDSVPFSVTDGSSDREPRTRTERIKPAGLRAPPGPRIEIGPVEVGSARLNAGKISGWINRHGYNFGLNGEIEIAQAMRLAKLVGVPVWSTSLEGSALTDLQLAGVWSGLSGEAGSGFIGPQLTGNLKLRNAEIDPRDLGSPVEITSADIQVSPGQLTISKLNAKAGGSTWSGSLQMPRGCGAACPVNLTLNANQIVLTQLAEWLNPSSKRRPWYRVLESTSQSPAMASTLHLTGKMSTDQFVIRGVAAKHVSGKLSLEDGKLQITELNADLLGGKLEGEWNADFSEKQALCKTSGKISGAELDGFAKAMSDGWIAGTANASYDLSGKCFGEFWQSAEGTLRVDMKNGVFPHLRIGDSNAPLRVTHLTGQADVASSKIQIKDAKLDSPDGKFVVTGSASFKRELDFKLTPVAGGGTGGTSYAITGSLSAPLVSPLMGPVQARLKAPPPGK